VSDLVAIAYPDEFMAAEVLVALRRLERQELIVLEDAAYITKDLDGVIKLHESRSLTAAGAICARMWEALVGLLLFTPIVGTDAGAPRGRLADYGLPDDFARKLAHELPRGSSALFILGPTAGIERALPDLVQYGGTVLRAAFPIEAEAKLRDALEEASRGLTASNPI
jgi:uncharacterized membrane protein